MFETAVEKVCDEINECFAAAANVDQYIATIEGPALDFAEQAWAVSMIMAAVVFAIVAILELYEQTVNVNPNSGPMGSAEAVFKVMFKVAVCYIVLQVSFNLLVGIYNMFNELTIAFGSIPLDVDGTLEPLDTDTIVDSVGGGLDGIFTFLLGMVVFFLSWASKWAAIILVMMRLLQIYLYICIAPIPIATFPSREYSQIGKSFLKSFIAVCLQGTLIYLVVRLMPAMLLYATEMGWGVPTESVASLFALGVLYSITILVTLMGTQALSRKICGAM